MLTDRKILGKLEQIVKRYGALQFLPYAGMDVEYSETKVHYRKTPGVAEGVRWSPAPIGTRWGGDYVTAWFRGNFKVPGEMQGKRLFIRAGTDGETLFFVDDKPMGVFDDNHPIVMLTASAEADREYLLSFEAYGGHLIPGCSPTDDGKAPAPGCKVFTGIDVMLQREDVTAFVMDLRVLLGLMGSLDENSLRRNLIIRELAKVFALVDMIPEETGEENWRPKLVEARRIMEPLLKAKNGPTMPWFAVIGHSHIDTAWLWPLSETWRKCARTFSSVLNLMDQYPEFMFLQTAPCHTEKVMELYPSVFDRISERVKEGRWEPNGAMWVEPDCNIPSGESFVRQLLLGQQATRKWFGYTSDTLWLPDVFGYSAALPQILKKAGVDNFCTSKISWNDTTRFPYDAFVWRGIDGSSVLSAYNNIHCFPGPQDLISQWNHIQHKDVQDRRICSYGYGDGGGGPMFEMVEIARRSEDLEGCPRSGHMSISKFMKGMERDLKPGLPQWSGELYLELHRGTLTSIAKVKKGNRKAEFALRDAEFLAASANLNGAAYPKERLESAWKLLCLNQFHDILPGSSIAEVNDEAVRDFDKCAEEARVMSSEALSTLTVPGNGALMAVNSLSWTRSRQFKVAGLPHGMAPVGEGIVVQEYEDIVGKAVATVAGVTIPAMGSTVLPLGPKAGTAQTASPFSYDKDLTRLDTPFAEVSFDPSGRIVRLLDKVSGRQVVPEGMAMNTFLCGEDVPQEWDNWDIDRDQLLKMTEQVRLKSRGLTADGPLQLRIRSVYGIGLDSELAQDMVFHSDSPGISFETRLDWKERHTLLKVSIPVDILSDTARHEIQYGHVERPTHTNLPQDRARFEVCAHKWTDISDGNFGVTLANDCKYGLSVTGGDMRLSLIKSGTHPDPRGDGGIHTFTYAVIPHATGFRTESVIRPAYELNLDPHTVECSPDTAALKPLAEIDAPNVIMESVKASESGDGFTLRLYEAGKAETPCRLRLGYPVKGVQETNLLEDPGEDLVVEGDILSFRMKPFEIKTLVFKV